MLFAKINKLSTTPFASVPVPPSRSVGISNIMVSVSPADNTPSPLSASSHTADVIVGGGDGAPSIVNVDMVPALLGPSYAKA